MRKRSIAALILAVYSAILIKVVVFKDLQFRRPLVIRRGGRTGYNFVPFETILSHLRGEPKPFLAFINLFANTAPFVPVGFLAALIFRRMTWRTALAVAVGVGLAMEAMEALFRVGIVDVDDVILNALGVMVGYGVFTIFRTATGDAPAPAAPTTATATTP